MLSEYIEFEKKIQAADSDKLKAEIAALAKKIDYNEIINAQLEKIVNDKYFIPRNTAGSRILLYTTEKFDLALAYIPPKKQQMTEGVLYSYTNDIYFCPLIDVEDYEVNVYEQTFTEQSNLIDENFILIPKETLILDKYDVLYVQKFKDLIRLNKNKPFLCLSYVSKDNPLNYSWEYNATTLRPTRIASVNVNDERINVVSDILSMIGNEESVDGLLGLCSHNTHTVRWTALNALINVDYEAGVSMLKKMSNDSHAEIREAANASLKLLKIE